MIGTRHCLLYTQDEECRRRIGAYLKFIADVRTTGAPADLPGLLEQSDPALLLLDLRARESRDLLPRIRRSWPESAVIALGTPRSDPLREALALGVYAAEDVNGPRHGLQTVVTHALDHMDLQQENRLLRERGPQAAAPGGPPAETAPADAPLRFLARAFRHVEDADVMLSHAADAVAAAAGVLRAGIFARSHDRKSFVLRAGVQCPGDVRQRAYDPDDPFPTWLEARAQLVSRLSMEHAATAPDRALARRALGEMHAEVIAPLLFDGRLTGWLLVGPRANGIPFTRADLEDLALLAEPIATALATALSYEEMAAQKTLLERLVHSFPSGVVAVDAAGAIRWFNETAEALLETPAAQVLGQPAELLGSTVADALRRALARESCDGPAEWRDPKRKRTLSVRARGLAQGEACLGAIALIQDVAPSAAPGAAEGEAAGSGFWTELASSMSHEIRNPLVAIKTFSQLLPERYGDPDFRRSFSQQVESEIQKLNGVVEQINALAYPPALVFRPVNVHRALKKGLNLARVRHPRDGIKFEIVVNDPLPPVRGDEQALCECFAHLVLNALEALERKSDPRIVLLAQPTGSGAPAGVRVTIRDNAGGIPAAVRERIFSPFCTTKARGMGLGLPIARRTVRDHGGQLQIDTGEQGTSVTVTLPLYKEEHISHEAPTHR